MTDLVKWDFTNFSGDTPAGWTSVTDLVTVGAAITENGITLNIDASWHSMSSGSGDWTGGAWGDVAKRNGAFYNTASIRYSGLSANTEYDFTYQSFRAGNTRSCGITDGTNSDSYTNTGVAPPAAPITIRSTSNGSGEVTHTFSADTEFTYGYANGVIIADVAASLTIDSTDASMQRDTNWQMVVSNPSTAPTTLNTTLTNDTTVLTPSSVTGSGPYTLTFPVGDMDKQVDATGYDWTLEITP